MRVTVAAIVAAALLLPTPPAGARTLTDRHCDNAGCEAVAGVERTATGPGGRSRRKPSTRTCQYVPMDLPPTASVVRPDGTTVTGDESGRWVEQVCSDRSELNDVAAQYPGTDPINDVRRLQQSLNLIDRRALFVRPANITALVDEARSRLSFPTLHPRHAPAQPWTFVNYPTDLWLDGGPFPDQSATAEVPGVRVTVHVEAQSIRWDTGDGASFDCDPGAGPPTAGPSSRPGCRHTWTWPSVGQPNHAYPVTATVLWHATWTVDGAPGGGDLGVIPQRSDVMPVSVAEIQILNTEPPR